MNFLAHFKSNHEMSETKLVLSRKYFKSVVDYLVRKVYLHPVTLQLVFEDCNLEDIENFDDTGVFESEKILEEHSELLKVLTWDYSPYPCVKNLVVFSKNNRMHKLYHIKIPDKEFRWECSNQEGISFRDIVGSVYRMKCQKYADSSKSSELLLEIKFKIEDEKMKIETVFTY